MAINVDLNNLGNNGDAPKPQPSTDRSEGQRPSSDNSRTFTQQTKNMSNIFNPFDNTGGQVLGRMIHPESGSEAFKRVVELLTKTAAETNGAIEIFPFPREIHTDLSHSVIAVVRSNKVPVGPGRPKHDFVTCQIWIMEATGEVPRAHEVVEGGKRWMVTPTIEDSHNTILVEYVSSTLRNHYGQETLVMTIDPLIIPREQDLTKDERLVAQLDVSITAVNTRTYVRIDGFQDYNYVANHGGKDVILAVSTSIRPETRTDLQNRPFYSDAEVVVSVEKNGPRTQGEVFHQPSTTKDVCATSVMVDLVPVDAELLEVNRSHRGSGFRPKAAWAPRLTAVNVDQFFTRTPAGILFALTSMTQLAADRAYAETFRPSKQRDAVNLRDIGYLNIEANLDDEEGEYGSRVPVQDASDSEIGKFLDLTVTRFPILAVDCMTTGPQAYYTTGLYNVARGRSDSARRAQAELYHSLRCATNGLIENFVSPDESFVADEGELIHVGYWIDDNGRRRDLRELDNYLAVAALSKNNPRLIDDWCATYHRIDIAEARRMSDRWNILMAISANEAVQTGTALRVGINDKVVSGFVDALSEAKLPMVSRGSGNGDAFAVHRAVSRTAGRSMYRGQGMAHSQVAAGGRATSRWAADRF
jgi:hypothetical protein